MAICRPRAFPASVQWLHGCGGIVFAALLAASLPVFASGDDLSTKALSVLSLEELMDVSIRSPAAITRLKLEESPASITSLSSEEIQRTPARNLMDLIEIYVPGAIWMNSEDGPLIGVRGSIGARNGRYLLLVNGKVLSSKGHYGAKSEIELWDLGDIKRLDIIRGPGSVTHGPGAVAGVISITTLDSQSLPSTRLSARYFQGYGSTGASLSQGSGFGDVDFLAYGGITRTTGYAPLTYLGSNDNNPGYVGRDIRVGGEPLDYFSDYSDIPQAKLYAEIGFLGNWKPWARYTQQGASWSGNESKTPYDGGLLNQQSKRDRQLSTEVEYRKQVREGLDVGVRAGAAFFDVERRVEELRASDPDAPENFTYNYSESEYMAGTASSSPAPIPGTWEWAWLLIGNNRLTPHRNRFLREARSVAMGIGYAL